MYSGHQEASIGYIYRVVEGLEKGKVIGVKTFHLL
jgi:hypothetical protein